MENENHSWDGEAGRFYDGSQWGKGAWNMVDSSKGGQEGKTPSEAVEACFVRGKGKPVPASEHVFIQDVPFPGNLNYVHLCTMYTM